MVQPRPAGGRPLPPLRRRRARSRELRPRQAAAREGADGGRARADRRLGPAPRHRRVELRDAARRVRGLGPHERARRRPLRPELPVRRARAAAGGGRPGDRPVRLGALHARAPRAGPHRLRRHLLGHRLRAAPLRRLGPRDPAGALGDPSGAARGPGPSQRRRPRPVRLPGRLPRPPQARRAGRRGVLEDTWRAAAAARQGAGRALAARGTAADDRGATSGSSCASPTSPGPNISPPSPPTTSRSPPPAGRASACRSTRRWRSGCRRSPTTTRR